MLKINKRIKRITAALLAAILFILLGCDNESLLSDPAPAGSTTLRLSTKGIAVPPSVPGIDWEIYVKTLRLIGFQEGKQVVNYRINDFTNYEVKGAAPDTYIEIPLNESTRATIKRGTLNLYAVANEEVANFTDNSFSKDITASKLEALSVIAKDSYSAPDANKPFLMSAQVNTTLLAEENSINVKLVRTLGKVELASVKISDGTDGEAADVINYTYTLSATGNVYATYPLFNGTGEGTTTLKGTATNKPLYLSESKINAVTISVHVTTNDGKTYIGTLSNEQITRNNCIQINATILKPQDCLQLDVAITPWDPKDIEIEYQ